MDPQECLLRILSLHVPTATRDEIDDWDDAFVDLCEWLEKGGFPPVCVSLGQHFDGTRRRAVGGRQHVIRQVDFDDDTSPYEFVSRNDDGRRTAWRLSRKYPGLCSPNGWDCIGE